MDNVIQGATPSGGEHSDAGATQLAAVTGTPVGQVTAASQPVHVTHTDGSTEDLGVGGQIYADDVVRTEPEGEVEITFVDGTRFSLGGNAEMQIDKLIYDPSGSDNSLALSVVQGAFVFVTGTIAGAPGEGMEVTTPAGSIGVRGTSVGGHYSQGPEGWIIALLKDANGHVGKVVVFNGSGEVVLDEVFESTKLIDFNTPPTVPVILTKEQIEALFGIPLELLPEIQMQIQLEGQRGDLFDIQTAAGGDGSPGGPNHGSHFYTFGLANFIFGINGGTIPATALGDDGPLNETKLVYDEPGGPKDPDDKLDNDNGPFGMVLTGGHIPENSPFGTPAGHVVAIVGGPPNATYTYSLVDENGGSTFRIVLFAGQPDSPAFEIDPVTGVITVHNPELMDFETTPDFFLTVRATSSNGQTLDVPFQIHLDDVNDNAPVIDPHEPIDLAENSAEGTVVGKITSHDADTTGEPTTYSIVGAAIPGQDGDYSNYFQINPETGEITLTEEGANSELLDYESGLGKIVLQVVASDGTNSSAPIEVEIDITDVDEAQWSINGATSVSEGGTATYTVSYSGATLAPGETMTIDVQTHAGSATDESDYNGGTTTLTFTGGQTTSLTVQVSTVGDSVVEGDEDYSVTIGNPSHGNVAGDGEVTTTIGDNDANLLSWQIDGPRAVEEGQEAIYTVSYSGAALADSQTATVTVQSHGGGGAQDGVDFSDVDQILTFTGGGVTAQTIAVETISDTQIETSENYTVDLTSDIGTTGSGVTTALQNPPPPVEWEISGSSFVSEGETATYTVSYSGGSLAPGETMTIEVQTHADSATDESDYGGVTTILTFTGGGDTSMTVEVSTTTDTVIEGDENYSVTIGNPSQGTVEGGTVNTVIGDGMDTILSWQIEGNSDVEEGQDAIYTVSYTGATLADNQTATVTVHSHGGGAQGDGIDFSDVDQVLTFVGGGATYQTIAVETIDDTQIEVSQDYSVDLSSNIGNTTGADVTTEIHDPVQWAISGSSSVTEGDAAVYTIGYSGGSLAPGEIAKVTIDTSSDTATESNGTNDGDYQGLHTVLTFTGGDPHTQTVHVATLGDNDFEGNEKYTVSITGADHGQIASGQIDTTIVDNDQAPDNGHLDGAIATNANHGELPVILTFVDENPLSEGDPLHAYSRLLVIGSEENLTKIDTDAGFTVDDTRTYRAALEMAPQTEGSSLDIQGVTLEGVDLGPDDQTITYHDGDSVFGDHIGVVGLLDPKNDDALIPMHASEDGNGDSDWIFGQKGDLDYLYGAGNDDSIQASTDPTIINGGTASDEHDKLMGSDGDDIIVNNYNAEIDGGGGFDILRVDDGALDLYQQQEQGNDTIVSSTVSLSDNIHNMDMILITEDAGADSLKGTKLELTDREADRITRSEGDDTDSSANLYIVGSKGDKLDLLVFGDVVDGNRDVPGIQPTHQVDDQHGQAFNVYEVVSDLTNRTTSIYVDTDIQVTAEHATA